MIVDGDGQPVLGRSARTLGVRTPAEGGTPDVSAVAPTDPVSPAGGGLSVAPGNPSHLPPFRRPVALGGRGRDPVWVIDARDLGPDLMFRPDSGTHGLIEPARPATLAEYEAALVATRPWWRLWTPGG